VAAHPQWPACVKCKLANTPYEAVADNLDQASEGAAFARLDNPALNLATGPNPQGEADVIKDETSGPDAPDIELIYTPLGYREHTFGKAPKGDMVGVQAVLLRYVRDIPSRSYKNEIDHA
jgi:hypothetical protein